MLIDIIPRALPWARSFCPFRACGENLQKFRSKCFGYPYAVFYSVKLVNYLIIKILIFLEIPVFARLPMDEM